MKLFIAAFLLAFCAAAQAPLPILSSRLTAGALRADVSFLASDALEGRGTPSRGLDIAGEYIAAQFRRAGLEPAGDDGYFQTANFVSVTPNAAGLGLTLEVGGKAVVADGAALTIQEGAALELDRVAVVRVPMEAAALDALSADQVRGKVLALLPGEGTGGRGASNAIMRGMAALAAKLQPALILIVRSAGPQQPAGRRGGRLHEATAAGAASPILAVADPAIRTALEAAEGSAGATATVRMSAPTVTPAKLRNVIGVLRGSDPVLQDTYVLITAHYDHLGMLGEGAEGVDRIFNGADDDASGTASAIEIACAIGAVPQRPRRSIVFIALFGEEQGLLGSRYYAAHPVFPLAKTVADVNLEQLGRTDDSQGPHVGMFNLTGFDFTDISTFFTRAGEKSGIKAVKDEKNSDPYFTRSDNAALAMAGVPSTTLSVAYAFPDYHKAGDEWQKLDYENMARVDFAIALAAIDIADSVEAPRWKAGNPKVEAFIKAREKSVAEASSSRP